MIRAFDDQLSEFVADLVQRKVAIIVVTGTREAITAKQATSSIPIVICKIRTQSAQGWPAAWLDQVKRDRSYYHGLGHLRQAH